MWAEERAPFEKVNTITALTKRRDELEERVLELQAAGSERVLEGKLGADMFGGVGGSGLQWVALEYAWGIKTSHAAPCGAV